MTEYRTVYVQDGNALRQIETEYDYEEYRRRLKLEEERRLREKRRAKNLRIRKKKLKSIYATMAIVFCVFFFVGYIYLQTKVNERTDNIASLETQISTLRADNKALESRINTSANLANVRKAALDELGMVYAGSDKIVYYSIEASDSMNQYSKVP